MRFTLLVLVAWLTPGRRAFSPLPRRNGRTLVFRGNYLAHASYSQCSRARYQLFVPTISMHDQALSEVQLQRLVKRWEATGRDFEDSPVDNISYDDKAAKDTG